MTTADRYDGESVRGMCETRGCEAEGIVGLQGAWLCLDHFDARLTTMKRTMDTALSIVRGER